MKRTQRKEEAPHLLIAMSWGIGDVILNALTAVDQIMLNVPDGRVKIDVMCNYLQAELLENDPRIYRLIQFDASLFPTNEAGSWKRGFILPEATAKLADFVRSQHYTAVLPFIFSPTFFYRLRTPVIFLSPREIWHILSVLRAYGDMPVQRAIRKIINKHFGGKLPEPTGNEAIPLYICCEHVQNATREMDSLKRQACVDSDQMKVLLVAPDTSSVVTRPPTSLLAEGIAGALRHNEDLFVALLPGYSDCEAASNLMRALVPSFPGRVAAVPAEPKRPLPEFASLIDQGDILITGDTGAMHLGVTTKMVRDAADEACIPRNTLKTIALFGGTHPGLFGYSKRTLILGKGRKEQRALTPGLIKEIYNPKGKNLFDHIAPQQLTDAILSQL